MPTPSASLSLSHVLMVAVLLITTAIYWPGLSGGFIFDDYPNIVQNADLRSAQFSFDSLLKAALSSDSGPLSRPLSMLSFAVQIAAAGLSPFALKLANLLIHLVNGLLIYFLSRRILDAARSDEPASSAETLKNIFPVAVAGAWLLAPVNFTPVLFVVQRMESLSTLFMLLGLLVYCQGRLRLNAGYSSGFAWMTGGLLAGTAFGVLCKETAVVLPAYAFILEWVLFDFRTPGKRRDGRVLGLFTGMLVIPGLLGVFATLPSALSGAAYSNRPFTLAERLLTEGRIVVDYLYWIIAPTLQDLSLYHDDYTISRDWFSPPGTLPAFMLLSVLFALALWLKNRRPLVSLGLLFYFAGHVLVSTYLPLELVYEHRNYLPSFGIFLAVFTFLLLEPSRANLNTLRTGIVMGLLVWFGFLTFLRANEWSHPVRLAFTEASRHPTSPRANYELGQVLMISAPDHKSPQFSIAMKSFEIADGLLNAGLLPMQAIIFMRGKHGLPVEERLWERLKQIISTEPLSTQDISALYSLLNCLIKEECHISPAKLGEVLALAAAKNTSRAVVLTLHANYAVNIAHDFVLGLKLMQRIVALEPRNFQYWKNLITLQIALGQLNEAQAGIERLRELDHFGIEQQTIRMLETDSANKATELRHQAPDQASS